MNKIITSQMNSPETINTVKKLIVKQKRELTEFIGFETRNKYEILDESGRIFGFAAEQQKGLFGFILRQFFGHWKPFTVIVFHPDKSKWLTIEAPFRFIFRRLEVKNANGAKLGVVQQRFAIFKKRFDLLNISGNIIMKGNSPFFKFWTFPFYKNEIQVAQVQKKWSGVLYEMLTDRDNFLVDFQNSNLSELERTLIIASALYIDLEYFENKANS